jgi:hypothetical protein
MPIPSGENVQAIVAAKGAIAAAERDLKTVQAELPEAKARADTLGEALPALRLRLRIAGDREGLANAIAEHDGATAAVAALEEDISTAEGLLQAAKDDLFRLQFHEQILRVKKIIRRRTTTWKKMGECDQSKADLWRQAWEETRSLRDAWPGGIDRYVNAAHGPLDTGALTEPKDMVHALREGLYHVSGVEFFGGGHEVKMALEGKNPPPSLPGSRPRDALERRPDKALSLAQAAEQAERHLLSLLDGLQPPQKVA